MKTKRLLLIATLLFAMEGQTQITPASNSDLFITNPAVNTGLAVAPNISWNAIVSDDFAGNYTIEWRTSAGVFQGSNTQSGSNPDVAYHNKEDGLVVAYENGGSIFVDSYAFPGSPYTLISTNNIASNGTNPNVDINSFGNGVLTWEELGVVYACSFTVAPFIPGTVMSFGAGSNPDIILLDNNAEVVLTYETAGGIAVRTFNHPSFVSGVPVLINSHFFAPTFSTKKFPRLASQRNSMFGPADDFTVVAQEDMGSSRHFVWGWFFNTSATFSTTNINNGLINCPTSSPRPVVTYDRNKVDIAWAQNYFATCASFPIGGGSLQDVLMGEFDRFGNNLFGPTVYQEVNLTLSNFSNSATALNSEYDGVYTITATNYCEGIAFSDAVNNLYWKRRDFGTTIFKTSGDELEDPITIVKAPDLGQIKVTVEGMESESELATFTLIDNTGRQIQLAPATQSGNTFLLDASSLSNGIYLLNCTVGNRTKTERIAHFK